MARLIEGVPLPGAKTLSPVPGCSPQCSLTCTAGGPLIVHGHACRGDGEMYDLNIGQRKNVGVPSDRQLRSGACHG